jgi:hypothetical protein
VEAARFVHAESVSGQVLPAFRASVAQPTPIDGTHNLVTAIVEGAFVIGGTVDGCWRLFVRRFGWRRWRIARSASVRRPSPWWSRDREMIDSAARLALVVGSNAAADATPGEAPDVETDAGEE